MGPDEVSHFYPYAQPVAPVKTTGPVTYGRAGEGMQSQNITYGKASEPSHEQTMSEEEQEAVYSVVKEVYTKEDFMNEAYIPEEKYDQMVSRLARKKNIIMQGAPGVGKSFLAKRLAYSLIGRKDEDKVAMVQFHQSYAYEDFVMGFRPNEKGGFDLEKGIFYSFCRKAKDHPDSPYFFVIDEINRGNLSKIFGELMLLIEVDKRSKKYAMPTTYSKELFYIPENLFIIGLMNTADRSLALMDYALRRRFSFIEIEPAFGKAFNKYTSKFKGTKLDNVINVVMQINEDITNDEALGRGFRIGHSYFSNLTDASDEELMDIVECELAPLIEEYWVENPKKIVAYIKQLREAIIYG